MVISCGAEVIARHPRSYEREDFIFEPLHYLALIEQKINALDQAAPLAGWRLPAEFATLRRLLEARMGKQGKREFVQVLRLMEVFRADEVAAAVRDAIARGAIGFDAVKHLVLCRIERRPPRLDMTVYPYLPQAHVAMTSAKTYLGLLTGAIMTDTPQLLLAHHLKASSCRRSCASPTSWLGSAPPEGLDHIRFLLRLAELELIERERRMVERRIKEARFPAVKSLDRFDFAAIPSLEQDSRAGARPLGVCRPRRENIIAVGNSRRYLPVGGNRGRIGRAIADADGARHERSRRWLARPRLKCWEVPARRVHQAAVNCVATIVVATAVAVVDANAESRRIQVGTLTCSLSAGIGLIVGSQRNVSCLFRGWRRGV